MTQLEKIIGGLTAVHAREPDASLYLHPTADALCVEMNPAEVLAQDMNQFGWWIDTEENAWRIDV